MDYVIKLTGDELNVVMKGLAELPLKESLATFNSINKQFVEAEQAREAEASKESNG